MSVVVRNSAGSTVRTLRSSGSQAAGTYSYSWNGTDSNGAALPAGTYSLVVTASTSAGTAQSSQAVQLLASVLSGVSVSPQAIYTGGDSTTLSYTLSGPATISVWVRNSAGTTVRTLRQQLLSAGTYSDAWDGKTDGGASVPAGDYSLMIAATTAAGTEQSTQTVQLVAPVLGSVSLSPATFYAGDGSTTFSYALSGPATTSVVVRNSGGTTVRTLRASAAQAAGSYSLLWDGKADDGNNVAAGNYSVTIAATTAAGTEQGAATVQLFAPVLSASQRLAAGDLHRGRQHHAELHALRARDNFGVGAQLGGDHRAHPAPAAPLGRYVLRRVGRQDRRRRQRARRRLLADDRGHHRGRHRAEHADRAAGRPRARRGQPLAGDVLRR